MVNPCRRVAVATMFLKLPTVVQAENINVAPPLMPCKAAPKLPLRVSRMGCGCDGSELPQCPPGFSRRTG